MNRQYETGFYRLNCGISVFYSKLFILFTPCLVHMKTSGLGGFFLGNKVSSPKVQQMSHVTYFSSIRKATIPIQFFCMQIIQH